MFGSYETTEVDIRALSDADSAGVIHQNPTLTDTISHRNVYWSLKPVTLTGNITIASGGELIIENGDTVSLGEYSIKSTGGILTEQGGGANWIPNIQISSKPYNRYPTIQSAINDASSGDSVLVKSSGIFNEALSMANGVSLINTSGDSVVVSSGGLGMVIESGDNNIRVDGMCQVF